MRLWIATIALCVVACGRAPDQSSDIQSMSASPGSRFPTIPEDDTTTGALCKNPDAYRYPEHIKYCNRSVSSSLKRTIIHTYDVRFQYHIGEMNRQEFKIDHLIPLCMGGANEMQNLWPQHRSVYILTDFLEERLCTGMAQGHLTQVEAISMIQEAKHDHSAIPAIKEKIDAIVR